MSAANQAGLTSVLASPLYARGELLGCISLALSRVTDRPDPHYDLSDGDLIGAIASRVAVAIDNAMLFEAERRTALAFQQSLLPHSVPELDGLEVAFRYVPAKPLATQGQGIQTQVGGDWYDIIPLAAGRVGLVIGDVEGRGARAAATMGQLRAALRAYAQDEKSPADIMRKLDEWVRSTAPRRRRRRPAHRVVHLPHLRRLVPLADVRERGPRGAPDGTRRQGEAARGPAQGRAARRPRPRHPRAADLPRADGHPAAGRRARALHRRAHRPADAGGRERPLHRGRGGRHAARRAARRARVRGRARRGGGERRARRHRRRHGDPGVPLVARRPRGLRALLPRRADHGLRGTAASRRPRSPPGAWTPTRPTSPCCSSPRW